MHLRTELIGDHHAADIAHAAEQQSVAPAVSRGQAGDAARASVTTAQTTFMHSAHDATRAPIKKARTNIVYSAAASAAVGVVWSHAT